MLGFEACQNSMTMVGFKNRDEIFLNKLKVIIMRVKMRYYYGE